MLNRRLISLAAITVFVITALFIFLNPLDVSKTPSEKEDLTAAIVDQLSAPQPNPEFVENSKSILKEAGFDVDYYEGTEVTVDFYRNLPSQNYDLIILRAHSAINKNIESTAFFTCENYSLDKYTDMQKDNQVMPGKTSESLYEGGPTYFVVNSRFVRLSIKGRFENTLIITTGCDSLVYPDMAQAFVAKGAAAYIGWRGLVMAEHTDSAASHLLQNLIIENMSLGEAAEEVWKVVGPDPTYKSAIQLYPPSAENFNFKNW